MYSDWQILRIRRALKAYYQFTRYMKDSVDIPDKKLESAKKTADEKAIRKLQKIKESIARNHKKISDRFVDDFLNWDEASWYNVLDEIQADTGVEINYESIRRFAVGYTDRKTGEKKIQTPSDLKLRAIIDFLSQEDVDYLSKEEIKQFSPSGQAAIRMHEYLDEFDNSKKLIPTSILRGTYEHYTVSTDGEITYQLSLQSPSDSGVMEAYLLEDFEFKKNIRVRLDRKVDKSKSAMTHYSGWAIVSPEDNLMIFLKNTENGNNIYYMTMAFDGSLREGGSLDKLYILRLTPPPRITDDSTTDYDNRAHVFDNIFSDILGFTKLPEFSKEMGEEI